MKTQLEKGQVFRALHARDRAFIIPNPWDIGTARLLERLGFEAVATTSAGYAFSVGLQDNSVDRDAMMKHLTEIAAATRSAGQRRPWERLWRRAGNCRGNDSPRGSCGRSRGLNRRCYGQSGPADL